MSASTLDLLADPHVAPPDPLPPVGSLLRRTIQSAPTRTVSGQVDFPEGRSFQGEVTIVGDSSSRIGRMTITVTDPTTRQSTTVDMYFDFADVTRFVVPRESPAVAAPAGSRIYTP